MERGVCVSLQQAGYLIRCTRPRDKLRSRTCYVIRSACAYLSSIASLLTHLYFITEFFRDKKKPWKRVTDLIET